MVVVSVWDCDLSQAVAVAWRGIAYHSVSITVILVAAIIIIKIGIITALLWVGTEHHRGGAVSAFIVSEMLARGCSFDRLFFFFFPFCVLGAQRRLCSRCRIYIHENHTEFSQDGRVLSSSFVGSAVRRYICMPR